MNYFIGSPFADGQDEDIGGKLIKPLLCVCLFCFFVITHMVSRFIFKSMLLQREMKSCVVGAVQIHFVFNLIDMYDDDVERCCNMLHRRSFMITKF